MHVALPDVPEQAMVAQPVVKCPAAHCWVWGSAELCDVRRNRGGVVAEEVTQRLAQAFARRHIRRERQDTFALILFVGSTSRFCVTARLFLVGELNRVPIPLSGRRVLPLFLRKR